MQVNKVHQATQSPNWQALFSHAVHSQHQPGGPVYGRWTHEPMNYLSNRVISSPVRPVTEQIPPPSRVQKSLDILADTLVKLKDELTQVKTEIAVSEASWQNLLNYAQSSGLTLIDNNNLGAQAIAIRGMVPESELVALQSMQL